MTFVSQDWDTGMVAMVMATAMVMVTVMDAEERMAKDTIATTNDGVCVDPCSSGKQERCP